jgi:hypothetical protein
MQHQAAATTVRATESSVQSPLRPELVEHHLSRILYLDHEGTFSDDHNLSLFDILEDIIDLGPCACDTLDNVIDAANAMLCDQGHEEFEQFQVHGKACPVTAQQREALKLAIVASNLPLQEPNKRAAE